jgi:predicted dehydrogenase
MKVLVVGFGSIGQRHLANLRLLEPSAEIVVLRRGGGGGTAPDGVQVVRSMDEALATVPAAAVVASPATFHVRDGLALARKGVHLLLEKPLSDTLEGVDELIEECRRRSLVLMTGYHLRFSPPLRRLREALLGNAIGRVMSVRADVGQFLPEWRPGTDYRSGVSARSDLGGGVVLELSHELDYVRWLAGEVEDVFARTGRLGDLEIDVEDTAEIVLRFASGAIGSVHLDMVRRPPARTCQIIGSQGTLVWDGLSHRVRLWTVPAGVWTDVHPEGHLDRNAMFVDELEHFLECVHLGAPPLVTGEDGRRVVEMALAAKESSRTGRTVALSPAA